MNLQYYRNKALLHFVQNQEKGILHIEHWRSISLQNVDYKIAAKVITNRMKSTLPKLIYETQTGFISGRYILENIR